MDDACAKMIESLISDISRIYHVFHRLEHE
jgi:hypothetical protein